MANEILTDVESSPIDNLPVAAGKRRRGRPRKVREAEAAAKEGPATSPDVLSEVKGAISQALAKKKAPDPLTRKGIVAITKQVARSTVTKLVRNEQKLAQPQPAGLESEIRDVIAAQNSSDVLTTEHGQSHPYWFLLRNR